MSVIRFKHRILNSRNLIYTHTEFYTSGVLSQHNINIAYLVSKHTWRKLKKHLWSVCQNSLIWHTFRNQNRCLSCWIFFFCCYNNAKCAIGHSSYGYVKCFAIDCAVFIPWKWNDIWKSSCSWWNSFSFVFRWKFFISRY